MFQGLKGFSNWQPSTSGCPSCSEQQVSRSPAVPVPTAHAVAASIVLKESRVNGLVSHTLVDLIYHAPLHQLQDAKKSALKWPSWPFEPPQLAKVAEQTKAVNSASQILVAIRVVFVFEEVFASAFQSGRLGNPCNIESFWFLPPLARWRLIFSTACTQP